MVRAGNKITMMSLSNNRAQSAVGEYVIFIIAIALAVSVILVFGKRSVMGKFKQLEESINYASIQDDEVMQPPIDIEPGCLLAGTQISLADGSVKPIEEIMLSDAVLSLKGKALKPGQVLKTMLHPKRKGYLVIRLEDNRELKVTANHPVFNGEKYQDAGSLKVGDTLFTQDSGAVRPSKIISIEAKDEVVDVYNLEISDLHNYFAQGVLVHNKMEFSEE